MQPAKRTWVLFAVLLLLLLPTAAEANPSISQEEWLGIGKQIFRLIVFALTVLCFEAIVVAAVLLCFQVFSPYLFMAIFAANFIFYLLLFIPLYFITDNVLLSEAAIVVVECAVIKLLACMPIFQMENFTGLKWRFAFMASCIGNLVSYALGFIR
jgi:hypothetical protein